MSNSDEQPSMHPLIWFHLYDYGTGKPYKETSATSVLRSSLAVPIIDQFRDAVKVKCHNKLSAIDANDLKVFKNKDSFDKRDADVGKEEPLHPTLSLNGLGSAKEILIVAIKAVGITNKMNVDLNRDSIIDSVYDKYIQFGHELKDCEMTQNLLNRINSLDNHGKELSKVGSKEALPFIFLDGSSGMGKTQTAFTLMCIEDLKVHYFVCSKSNDNDSTEQNIYKRYTDVSHQFLECIDLDYKTKGNIDSHLSNTCGFVVSLITGRDVFEPMTLSDGSKAINSHLQENRSEKNIVFLDEFPPVHKNTDLLRWMRNLFRKLHLVTICCSTSSSAANLIRASVNSRDSNTRSDWCYIYPRFPKVLSLCAISISPFGKYLFNNSRPLFSSIFEEQSFDNPQMDISQILGYVGTEIHGLKKKFNEAFAHGQICLLLAIYHIVFEKDGNKNDASGVFSNSHFANLLEDDEFLLQLKSASLFKKGARKGWSPHLSFPSPNEDILLFLCLMGNKGYYPICKSGTTDRIPFRKSLNFIKRLGKLQRGTLNLRYENPEVPHNTGLELEAMSTAIISLCSHYEGLHGIEFGTFLSHVLYELELLESLKDVSCQIKGFKLFSKIVIPFLSAPSVPWPEELFSFDYNFCNLGRNLNAERIDFSTSTFTFENEPRILSGECKDWKKNIPVEEFENILVRIPRNSVIHLVFARNMSEQYYGPRSQGKTFESFVKNITYLENKLILWFDQNTEELAPIPGVPMKNVSKFDGLVLFICLKEDLNHD